MSNYDQYALSEFDVLALSQAVRLRDSYPGQEKRIWAIIAAEISAALEEALRREAEAANS